MLIPNLHALAREHSPVAILEIADRVGEWRQSDRVGAEIHLAIAVANRERRSFASADQKIVLARKKKRERKSAAQLLERGGNRIFRRFAAFHFLRNEMRHRFGIGVTGEFAAAVAQSFAELTEILDN